MTSSVIAVRSGRGDDRDARLGQDRGGLHGVRRPHQPDGGRGQEGDAEDPRGHSEVRLIRAKVQH